MKNIIENFEENDIIDLHKINSAIYDRFCFLVKEQEPPLRDDFFKIERFHNIDKSQIFKLMAILIRDLKLFEGTDRNGKAYTIIFLTIDDYNRFLQFKDLVQKKAKEIKGKNPNRVSFDENRSVLIIDDKEVKVGRHGSAFYVLKVLFKSPYEECYFDVVFDNDDSTEKDVVGIDDKKYYNAMYHLNKKIAVELKIDDFFITTRHSVKIDEKYLS